VVGNLASQAVSSVESEVRKSETASELRRFAAFFPQFASEHFCAEYQCHALMGNGVGVAGSLYVTDAGVHFTTRRPDGAVPPTIVFQFDMSFNQIASIVKGSALGHEWLHLMYDNGQFRSIYNVITSTTAAIGEVLSTSVRGSAYSRLYAWLDHNWRPRRFGPGGLPPPVAPIMQMPMVPPASAPMPAGLPQPLGAPVVAVPVAAQGDADANCVICLEQPKNQFFQPCGHVCCCKACASNIRECPLCRAPIQQAFQAFL
jgi:hypothetical protein